jgi:hypothetical protein
MALPDGSGKAFVTALEKPQRSEQGLPRLNQNRVYHGLAPAAVVVNWGVATGFSNNKTAAHSGTLFVAQFLGDCEVFDVHFSSP